MAFCQALWATVTRPPQPGPPHHFSPSSVLHFGPPHSLSEQSAPGGVPHVCNEPRVRHKRSQGQAQELSGLRQDHGTGWVAHRSVLSKEPGRWGAARLLDSSETKLTSLGRLPMCTSITQGPAQGLSSCSKLRLPVWQPKKLPCTCLFTFF